MISVYLVGLFHLKLSFFWLKNCRAVPLCHLPQLLISLPGTAGWKQCYFALGLFLNLCQTKRFFLSAQGHQTSKHQCARQTLCMIKRGWALNPSNKFLFHSHGHHHQNSTKSYIWFPFTKLGRKTIYTTTDIYFKYKILKLNT